MQSMSPTSLPTTPDAKFFMARAVELQVLFAGSMCSKWLPALHDNGACDTTDGHLSMRRLERVSTALKQSWPRSVGALMYVMFK